jgi:hypothetical protein
MNNVERLCREWPHRWFGFFRLEGRQEGGDHPFSDLPVVTEFIDKEWKFPRMQEALDYLERCPYISAPVFPSQSKCLLCDELLRREVFHRDGTWLWPGSLGHYVRVHSVRLPDKMLHIMEEKGFAPPSELPPISDAKLPWPPEKREFTLSVWIKELISKRT